MTASELPDAPEVLSSGIVLQNLFHPFPDIVPFAVSSGNDQDFPVLKQSIQNGKNEVISEIAVERIENNNAVPMAQIRYGADHVNIQGAAGRLHILVIFRDSAVLHVSGPLHGFDKICRTFPAAKFIIRLREKQCPREHILQQLLQTEIGTDTLGCGILAPDILVVFFLRVAAEKVFE